MRITSSHIILQEMRFYAYHGVLPQERIVGGDYTVSVEVETDVTAAIATDDVGQTLNYAALYEVVKREMLIPSNLLEHVAARIGKAVMDNFPQVQALDLTVTKQNPPMGADCQGAGVKLHIVKS
jgi:dihydroneopterin aldolase